VAKRGAVILASAVIGSLLTLAVLAVAVPERLFGLSRDAIEYSLYRQAEGTAECKRRSPWRWQCVVFDGQESIDIPYDLRVSPNGCWTATSPTRTVNGCLGLEDYVRVMER